MKLILSVEALSPQLTGVGRYTWELASRLPKHRDIDSIRFYRNKRWVKDAAQLLFAEKLPPRSWIAYLAEQLRSPKMRAHEIFHGPNFLLPEFVEGGVATIHDLSVFHFPEMHPPTRLAQFEKEFAKSLKRAAQLITVSETVRQEVIQYFQWQPNKITAVLNGVSPSFKPRSPDSIAELLATYDLAPGAYALCVSTIEPRKNIDRLLAAYASLPEVVKNRYPLVLIGSKGWLSEGLHEAIEQAQRQGWLRYLGFVSETAMAAIYAGARAFAFPSMYEGFGLPVIEAMASGVPVVTSNRSCLPEVSRGAALLVDPDDVDALRAAIRKSLEDESWRAEVIGMGLAVAAQYSWERCVEETLAVYAKVAALQRAQT